MNSLSKPLTGLAELCRLALQTGLSLFLQMTALLLLGLLLGRLARRYRPASRSFLYRATLAGVFLLFALSLSVGGRLPALWHFSLPAARQSAPAPPREITEKATRIEQVSPRLEERTGAGAPLPEAHREERAPLPHAAVTQEESKPVFATVAPPELPLETSPVFPEKSDWLPVSLVGLYLGVTFALLAWLSVCALSLERLRRRSTPIHEGEAADLLRALCDAMRLRPPLLCCSPAVQSPFLAGLFRPVLFLPASYAADFDTPALRAVFAHELAHLARQDCWWTLLARLTCAFGWLNPLLWVLARRLDESSEEACDQAVLDQNCSARAYADCLLKMAERLKSRPARALGVGVMPFRSSLGRRIQYVLDAARSGQRGQPLSFRLRATITLGIACAVALCPLLVSGKDAPATPQKPLVRQQKPAPKSDILTRERQLQIQRDLLQTEATRLKSQIAVSLSDMTARRAKGISKEENQRLNMRWWNMQTRLMSDQVMLDMMSWNSKPSNHKPSRRQQQIRAAVNDPQLAILDTYMRHLEMARDALQRRLAEIKPQDKATHSLVSHARATKDAMKIAYQAAMKERQRRLQYLLDSQQNPRRAARSRRALIERVVQRRRTHRYWDIHAQQQAEQGWLSNLRKRYEPSHQAILKSQEHLTKLDALTLQAKKAMVAPVPTGSLRFEEAQWDEELYWCERRWEQICYCYYALARLRTGGELSPEEEQLRAYLQMVEQEVAAVSEKAKLPGWIPVCRVGPIRVAFGTPDASSLNDMVQYNFLAQGGVGKCGGNRLHIIIEYYDSSQKLLSVMDHSQGGSNGSITPFRFGGGSCYWYGSPSVQASLYIRHNAPQEAVTAKYHYEARGALYEGEFTTRVYSALGFPANPTNVTELQKKFQQDPWEGKTIFARDTVSSETRTISLE